MAIKDGDVVRFDYTLSIDGEVRETSTETKAKEHGIHKEGRTYSPLTFTVGGRQIIPGLEKEVVARKQGDSFTATIPAADAYGERDPKKIQTIPMAQFRKQGVKPEPGQLLNWNNQRVVVTQVAGGRVRVDGNHELAGQDLTYDVTVTDVLTKDDEKLPVVLEMLFGTEAVYTYDGKSLDLEVPDQAKFSQDWPMMKFRVLTQIRQVIGLDKPVRLIESYPAMPADLPGAAGAGAGEEE